MKSLKSNKGFTLIELVVVIAILGILAGIAIPRFMDATATARGAKIVADMRTIDSAAMLYQAKTGDLPGSIEALTKSSTVNGGTIQPTLAAWPVPPTGTAKITNNAGASVTITPTATEYTLGSATASDGTQARALYGKLTVDGILAIAK